MIKKAGRETKFSTEMYVGIIIKRTMHANVQVPGRVRALKLPINSIFAICLNCMAPG